MPEEYEMECKCPNCKAVTNQKFITSGHERDSFGGTQECLVCHWYADGWGNNWQPPLESLQLKPEPLGD